MDEQSLQERFAPRSICFGCGPANARGLRIRSFASGDEVFCKWRPEAHHQAFEGVLNGGILGALLDCHANWTAGWHLMERDGCERPPVTVTAEFTVRLRRPTPADRPLRMTARVVESSGPKVTVEASVTAGEQVTAIFSGRFVAVDADHPAARHGLGAYDGGGQGAT